MKRRFKRLAHLSKRRAKVTMKRALRPKKENYTQMRIPKTATETEAQTLIALDEVRSEISSFRQHKLIKLYDSYHGFIFYSFVKGAAFGLGSIIGATFFLSVAAYVLSHFEFLPVVGEWITILLQEISEQEGREN